MDISNSVFLRGNRLVMIDRRLLPGEIVEYTAGTFEEVAIAVEDMVVQGAGDIAITAGYGLYLEAQRLANDSACSREAGMNGLRKAADRLIATRPTGHYISALLEKMMAGTGHDMENRPRQMLYRINRAIEAQRRRSEMTGFYASEILEDGDTIMTHCFPGAGLLYMLTSACKQGKRIKLIAGETRPYLQGARLTAWAVSELGIPVTLITDNMAACCMSSGMIDRIFTAADRVAMDGTVANKVGTLQIAIVAKNYGIPLYVLGYGGPDTKSENAGDIPVEIRDPAEVLNFMGKRITGDRVEGFYPAFDLTPPALVKQIVTDRGLFDPENIKAYWLTGRDGVNQYKRRINPIHQ